jgi:hypothetical protein
VGVLAAGISFGDISTIAGVAVVASALASGIATFFIRRRTTSGKIETSEAAILWAQSQEMRTQLLAEKLKIEEQRDRILAIQTDQVVPIMTSASESLKQILIALKAFDYMLESQARMELVLKEIHDAATQSVPKSTQR